jgi:hypothetical protein
MVVSYELAQLSTTARKLPRAGAALLVLGSGNVDEVRVQSCSVDVGRPFSMEYLIERIDPSRLLHKVRCQLCGYLTFGQHFKDRH